MSRSSHRRQLYQDQTPSENFAEHSNNTQKEEQIPQMNDIPQPVNTQPVNNNVLSGDVQDETSVITASTVLTGDLQSSGSFDIRNHNGNVSVTARLLLQEQSTATQIHQSFSLM